MKYTRIVKIEYSETYENFDEAMEDEDNFLSQYLIGNGEIIDNKVEDEAGVEILDDRIIRKPDDLRPGVDNG